MFLKFLGKKAFKTRQIHSEFFPLNCHDYKIDNHIQETLIIEKQSGFRNLKLA